MNSEHIGMLNHSGISIIGVEDTPTNEEMDYLQLILQSEDGDYFDFGAVAEELKGRGHTRITLYSIKTELVEESLTVKVLYKHED